MFTQNPNKLKIGDHISEFFGNRLLQDPIGNRAILKPIICGLFLSGNNAQTYAYRYDKAYFDKLCVAIIGLSGDELKILNFKFNP